MLINQTIEKLKQLRLPSMAAEYARQTELPDMAALDFDERLAMLVDAQWLTKENHIIKRLYKEAGLRFSEACLADISYRPVRKLDRSFVARLSDLTWMKEAKNLIITGSTGTGKTYLACAFGAEACRRQLRVKYYRVGRHTFNHFGRYNIWRRETYESIRIFYHFCKRTFFLLQV